MGKYFQWFRIFFKLCFSKEKKKKNLSRGNYNTFTHRLKPKNVIHHSCATLLSLEEKYEKGNQKGFFTLKYLMTVLRLER